MRSGSPPHGDRGVHSPCPINKSPTTISSILTSCAASSAAPGELPNRRFGGNGIDVVMIKEATAANISLHVDDNDLYDIDFLCHYFGGTGSPLHPATIFRNINAGRISRPVKTASNVNRWLGAEIKADRQQMIEAERKPLPAPKHRRLSATNQSGSHSLKTKEPAAWGAAGLSIPNLARPPGRRGD